MSSIIYLAISAVVGFLLAYPVANWITRLWMQWRARTPEVAIYDEDFVEFWRTEVPELSRKQAIVLFVRAVFAELEQAEKEIEE